MANLRYKKDMIIYRNLQIYEASKRAFEERLAMSQEVAHLRKKLEAAQAERELMQAMYWGPEYARAYANKQQEEHNDRLQKEYARQHLAQYTLAQQTDYFRYLQAYQNQQLYEVYQRQAEWQAYHQAQAEALHNPQTPPQVPRHHQYADWQQQNGILDSPTPTSKTRNQNPTPPYAEAPYHILDAGSTPKVKREMFYPSAEPKSLDREYYTSPKTPYNELSATNSLVTQASAPSTPPPTHLNSLFSNNDAEQVPTPSSVSTVRPKKHNIKQYARHINESLTREKIAIARAEKTDERLNGDLGDILQEVEALRGLKDKLCGMLGDIGDELKRGRVER
jgi:hypothetical protein